MKRLLALVCLAFCYCSYSWADGYSATYSVGDTGPNGGTVTSVVVDSSLGDTTTELIGGFQETTETWNHTETVTEVVTTQVETTEVVETITEVVETVVTTVQTPVESTVTTEVKTPTTTDNLAPDLNSTNYSKSGKVIIGPNNGCSYSGSVLAKEACFGSANSGGSFAGGGTITSNKFDIDTDMTEKELNEGFDIDYGLRVESHSSNTQVPLCQNTSGDCKDKFTMTVNLYKSDNSLINSYSHSVILDYNGQRNFSWDQTIGANTYELGIQAEFVIFGVDAGWVRGYWGPIVYDPWLTVTYDVISYVTETITTYVTEQVIDYVTTYVTSYETITNIEEVQTTYTSEFTDTTTVFTSEYIGDPVADIPVEETTPILEDSNFTVEIEDIEGNVVASFEIDVVEVSPGTVEVQMTSTDMDTGIAEIETVSTIEAFSEIETFDSSTGSDMGASVDSIDSLGDLAGIDTSTSSAEPEIDVEVTGEVTVDVSDVDVAETSVDNNIEVNTTSTVEDTSTSDANDAGENTGTTETPEGGATSEGTESESNDDTGSVESTSESGDSGDEEQETSDVQENESESSETEEVQESSSDVDESMGDSESNSDEGEGTEDGDDNKESSSKSGSGNKKAVSKNPKQVKKATKAAITKKILQQIQQRATEDFAAGENLRLILLSIQGDTEAFKEYQTKIVQKQNDWYVDNGIYNDVKQLEDPYAVLYSLAQDRIHNEMVEEQYND